MIERKLYKCDMIEKEIIQKQLTKQGKLGNILLIMAVKNERTKPLTDKV